MSGRRLVFLDFDGVVMTEASYERAQPAPADCEDRAMWCAYARLDPALVANVATLCDRAGADVVLSTNWRGPCAETNAPNVEALRRRGLTAPIVGWTPRVDAKVGRLFAPASRGTEILAWLTAHRLEWASADLVILEDEEDVAPFERRCVRTTWVGGFGEAQLAQALRLFGCAP